MRDKYRLIYEHRRVLERVYRYCDPKEVNTYSYSRMRLFYAHTTLGFILENKGRQIHYISPRMKR